MLFNAFLCEAPPHAHSPPIYPHLARGFHNFCVKVSAHFSGSFGIVKKIKQEEIQAPPLGTYNSLFKY